MAAAVVGDGVALYVLRAPLFRRLEYDGADVSLNTDTVANSTLEVEKRLKRLLISIIFYILHEKSFLYTAKNISIFNYTYFLDLLVLGLLGVVDVDGVASTISCKSFSSLGPRLRKRFL